MARGRLGGIGDALADRNFRFYSVGAIVSWLSFFIQKVAVSWAAWELEHSTVWLAVVAILDIAPNILFLPLGGVLADRFDRLRIVQITHALALLQALALAVLAGTGHLTIFLLAALSFVHGAIHSFSVPGLFGMLPRFVARERLSSAIAVSSSYSQFAIFAGPALAGWIILHFGAATAFATNVVGYAAYLVTLFYLRTPPDYRPPAQSGQSIMADIVSGARYIGSHRGISALLLLMLLGDAMSAAIYQMLPAYSAEILLRGVDGVSILMAAAGLGATIAALWLAHGGAARATPHHVLWSFLALIVAVACLALAGNVWLAAMAALAFGIAGEIRRTGTVSLLQLSVSEDQRGRVMGTQFLLQRIAGGIGIYLVGALAEQTGLRLPILLIATLSLVAWGFAFRRRTGISAAFEQYPIDIGR